MHGAPVQLDVGVAHGPELAVGAFELLQGSMFMIDGLIYTMFDQSLINTIYSN